MPTYVSKILQNYILIEFQASEDKTITRVLDKDYWKKVDENCWRAPYSKERAAFAKEFCENPQKFTGIYENRNNELHQVVEKRQIEYFVHFTNAKNLENIFKYGLLSVREMQNRGIEYISNDRKRFDEKLGGISLSVSFPNYKMFYNKYQLHAEYDWAVLLIEPKQVLDLRCRFYAKNAASSQMQCKGTTMSLVEEFESMFLEDDAKSRERMGIPTCFTTDPQAEILVFDDIPVSAIHSVCFENDTILRKYNHFMYGHGVKVCVNKMYFDRRRDYM